MLVCENLFLMLLETLKCVFEAWVSEFYGGGLGLDFPLENPTRVPEMPLGKMCNFGKSKFQIYHVYLPANANSGKYWSRMQFQTISNPIPCPFSSSPNSNWDQKESLSIYLLPFSIPSKQGQHIIGLTQCLDCPALICHSKQNEINEGSMVHHKQQICIKEFNPWRIE